jgi:hypothetical protein
MMPPRRAGTLRKALSAAAIGLPFFICGAAHATDCNQDIGALTKKRQGIIDQLNQLAQQGGKKKQLDPVASCPKLRALVAVEREFVAYLTKNKEWCSVPDIAFQNLSAGAAKTVKVANQACTVAEQMKKAQEQQAAGALNAQQKLPSGPL